jgi:hypothetical protein
MVYRRGLLSPDCKKSLKPTSANEQFRKIAALPLYEKKYYFCPLVVLLESVLVAATSRSCRHVAGNAGKCAVPK